VANITYVNELDEILGYGPKQKAIDEGLRHRISRVFIFDGSGNLIIQKRGPNMSLPGKWDQSAAGHVDEGETYEQAAYRELQEELGLEGVPLSLIGNFYSEERDDGLVKKRFNAVYVGRYSGDVTFGDEVCEVRSVSLSDLVEEMMLSPERFTSGFVECVGAVRHKLQSS
jgi:isopentenyldiphosphate isomerase